MAIVNYVRENMAFIEYASDNGVTANERLLWYALFHLLNMRAEGAVWPDGFISISNKRLLSYLPYSEDALITARNRLSQRGIIKYKPGQRNTQSPMYMMSYFSTAPPQLSTETAKRSQCYPEISGNVGGNMQGNKGGNDPGNMRGNMGDFNINLNVSQNANPVDDGVSTQRLLPRTREEEARKALLATLPLLSARQRLHLEWLEEFDSDVCAKAEFAQTLCDDRFTGEQVACALSLVQSKWGRGKVAHAYEYLKAVLLDWDSRGLIERADIEDYITDGLTSGCALRE